VIDVGDNSNIADVVTSDELFCVGHSIKNLHTFDI
jgi:hypothetical protein